MKIHGFQKLTLLDYPGHLAAVLFLGGCNYRCPFCQNAGLVLSPETEPFLEEEEVLSCLKKRQGILEGVCITGGEPTLHESLPDLIAKIKALGYHIKLDTNGSRPQILKQLHKEGLLDYVAMDIKSSPSGYGKVCGRKMYDMEPVRESVDYLMRCGLDYEFRTTVVKELHSRKDFEEIAQWISGCRKYVLQAYRDSETVIQRGFHSYTRSELEDFQALLRASIPLVEIRGIEEGM